MSDLFQEPLRSSVPIDLPDARILFFRQALSPSDAQRYFDDLYESVQWTEEEVVVWGKRHKQPRLVAWFGDPGAKYTYSGSTLNPQPWTPLLQQLRSEIEELADARFNSVLLNLYRNHLDRMGWHSDDEPALGRDPIIASLSLGESRIFQMKHKRRPELGIKSFELASGSLLLMSGSTQRYWLHSVRKESRPVAARINLTFRRIVGA
ncbi:MAG: alpha-ketoglutarate-dependent dioxygenase AlkB [Nevskia sp.]|nr:alpha-ketoglutarate-dependent dioxygenase AlkB [Nevskia sp.]